MGIHEFRKCPELKWLRQTNESKPNQTGMDFNLYEGFLWQMKKTRTAGLLKDGEIEIQGDYSEKVGDIPRKDGWEIK